MAVARRACVVWPSARAPRSAGQQFEEVVNQVPTGIDEIGFERAWSRAEGAIVGQAPCRSNANVALYHGRPRSNLEEGGTVSSAPPTVIVIDDDLAMRESLGSLLRSVGFQAKLFASVAEFLKTGRTPGPSCLVLDVRLPGKSGLDLQRELAAMDIQLPIVFITAHGDIPMSVRAMKGGAIEFLTKPFRDQDLLDAIQIGLDRDRAWLEGEKSTASLRTCLESLSPREREVMLHVVAGRLNKQIAGDMGISEVTVKVHRGQVMRKMNAGSLPELALMVDKLGLSPAR